MLTRSPRQRLHPFVVQLGRAARLAPDDPVETLKAITSTPQKPVDPTVVSCAPTIQNLVAAAEWWAFTNETALPSGAGPPAVPAVYSLSARSPLP